MMRPHFLAFMPGTAARMAWKAAERLMAMIWSHFSIGKSSIGATCWMPALLTRMSTAPNASCASRDHGGDLVGLCHVGGRIDRLDAELALDPGALRLDLVRLAEAVDHDVRALLGEGPRDGEADAARRAGHDGRARLRVMQLSRFRISLCCTCRDALQGVAAAPTRDAVTPPNNGVELRSGVARVPQRQDLPRPHRVVKPGRERPAEASRHQHPNDRHGDGDDAAPMRRTSSAGAADALAAARRRAGAAARG